MGDAWPFIGRSEPLDVVTQALRENGSSGAVIAAPAGFGRTRLAREVADRAAQAGFRVRWAIATSALASIPFGAVAHLLADGSSHASEDRLELMQRIATDIRDGAGDGSVLLVIDDAHLVDDGTAALVQLLVTARAARVVLTVRSDEVIPEAVTTLWKDGYLARYDLPPLGVTDVERLVAAVLGFVVADRAAERLVALSGGNVLLLRELIDSARGSGALQLADGCWRWYDRLRPSVRLRELLGSRISRVSGDANDIVELVALGEPIPLAVLHQVGNPETVVALERADIVVVSDAAMTGPAVVRLAHPLYHDIVSAGIGAARRRAIAAALAERMDPYAVTPTDHLRIAAWRLECDDDIDPQMMTNAAAIANARYDHELAARLARAALEHGGQSRAAYELGSALNRLGRTDEGEAVLAGIATNDDDERVAVARARAFGLSRAHGFGPEVAAGLFEAERSVAQSASVAMLEGTRATVLAFAGAFDESIALAGSPDANEEGPSSAEELAGLRRVPALGASWSLTGRPDRTVELAREYLPAALARAEAMPEVVFWVGTTLLNALTVSGRLDEADALVALTEQTLVSEAGAAQVRGYLSFVSGAVALMRGQARRAQQLLRNVEGSAPAVALSGVYLVEAYAMTREAEAAQSAHLQAQRATAMIGAFEGAFRRSSVWLAVARGQLTRAAELALETAAWCESHGHYTAELFALHDAVRLGRAVDALPRLEQLVPSCQLLLAPLFLDHARSAAAGDAAGLASTARAFEFAGTLLRASEASGQAAAADAAAGHSARAQRARARARTLLAQCDGAHALYIDMGSGAAPLSSREREVAMLAARGLTSAAIGERLFLSRRTVEGHLHRAYAKLGFTKRAELMRHYEREVEQQ